MYEKMEELDDDENDMLNLPFGVSATETSGLGFQVKITEDLDGLTVKLLSRIRTCRRAIASRVEGEIMVVGL